MDDMIARVSGDDGVEGLEAVGARRRHHGHGPAGHPRGPAGTPLLARGTRETWRRAPLGLGNFSLLTGTSVTLSGQVQRPFQANRLLVTASDLGILITSIKVGDEEQVLNGSVPAELYGPEALTDSEPDDFTPGATAISFSVTLNNTNSGTVSGAVGFKGWVQR